MDAPAPMHSAQAERSLVATMLAAPEVIPEVIGAQVDPDDFYTRDARLIFEAAVEAYYANEGVSPVVVAERRLVPLARALDVSESQVAGELHALSAGHAFSDGQVLDVAAVVRRHGDLRRIQALALSTLTAVAENELSPEEIGDRLTTEAAQITAGKRARAEILDWRETGSQYLRYLRRVRLAREQGIEVAAYCGHKFIDGWTMGLMPGEVFFLAGEPGVGKSAVAWEFAQGFARRQMLKPADRRVATLILSLEMGLVGSSARIAQTISGLSGERLREATVSEQDVLNLTEEWRHREGLPLYFNYASNFRLSQLRALIVEAIRRYNVGLIVLDHFRQIDPDRRVNNPNQEDEVKVRFLKEALAKELDLAVMCLAHTVKPARESDGRPRLADLRGSGQVAAHADIVAMMYRPIMYATEEDVISHAVLDTEAEMLYRKNRNGALGSARFYFAPHTMAVRDEW